MQLLMLALSAHFIGDFGMQSRWMATEKGKSWEILFYHVAIYTATLVLAFMFYGRELSMWSIAIIFITHFLIDACKSRWNIIELWIDQVLHCVVLSVIVCIMQQGVL